MKTDDTPDGFNPDLWRSWDQKSKEKFLAALAESEKERKVWYCTRGRTCDGEPHGKYTYRHARSDQWPPKGTNWLVFLLMGGRGSGKSRSGSEWLRKMSQTVSRSGMLGPTYPHVREIMIEGESGLLKTFGYAGVTPLWEPSKRRITLPNGHIISVYTGEEPDRLRGPEHGAFWLDEPAHISMIDAVWDNMLLGLRLGMDPKVVCTTTPLPIKWLKDLIEDDDTVVSRVSSYANLQNMAPPFRKKVLSKYEGTRMGRQELHGEILEDVEGALWTWEMIEDHRERLLKLASDFDRIVVAIDPAGTSSKKRDETGIIVIGKKGNEFWVLADGSGHYTPNGWAKEAWRLFDLWGADKVIAEKNYGGEMVLTTLMNERPNGSVGLVNSRRGKKLRAEPIVGLYEQQRFHHNGIFEELETQQTTWVPGESDSPDRVDALVHGATELSGVDMETNIARPKPGNMYAQRFGQNLIPAR